MKRLLLPLIILSLVILSACTITQTKKSTPKCPNGELKSDFFDCNFIKQLESSSMSARDKNELTYNIENLDCSLNENVEENKLFFQFSYSCSDGKYIHTNCYNEGWEVKPVVHGEHFPSLEETYFDAISFSVKNIGCTKIDLENYYIYFSLYENGIKKGDQVAQFDRSMTSFFGEMLPDKSISSSVGFGKILFPKRTLLNTNKDLTAKACLIKTEGNVIQGCDFAYFNIEYKN